MPTPTPSRRTRVSFVSFFCAVLPAYAALTLFVIALASGLPAGLQSPLYLAWGIGGLLLTFYALGKTKRPPGAGR